MDDRELLASLIRRYYDANAFEVDALVGKIISEGYTRNERVDIDSISKIIAEELEVDCKHCKKKSFIVIDGIKKASERIAKFSKPAKDERMPLDEKALALFMAERSFTLSDKHKTDFGELWAKEICAKFSLPTNACPHGYTRIYDCSICSLPASKGDEELVEALEEAIGFCVNARQTWIDWEDHQDVGILYAHLSNVLSKRKAKEK